MHETWILTIITFFPLLGALAIMFIPRTRPGAIKWTAIAMSLPPLALSVLLWIWYRPGHGMQFEVSLPWITAINVRYHMGADGISIPMIALTALLTTLSLVYSLIIEERPKEFFWLFLVLETGMFGVFSALDFILFYVFWEVSLVPMYFLIGVWGGPKKEYAAIKFFLYTLVGSVAMLLAILGMYFNAGTFDMLELARLKPFMANFGVQSLAFWALFLAFAIKVPIWPFHTWLPDAHVEAPTAGSVILAGILLKMGCYGFLRVLLPIFPEAARHYWMHIAILALISIIYGALVAMAQKDMKKLIAYSSVNHMGYVMLGIAAAASAGAGSLADRATALNGAMMQMFNHGVITGSLFLLVGIIYERTHNRDLSQFGGLWARVPIYGGLLVTASLASLGLPGMSGFISEFFVFKGTFGVSVLLTGLAVIGVVITAAFFLWMIQRVLMGPLNPKYDKISDVDIREVVSLAPLVALMIALGVYPALILRVIDASARMLAKLFV